MNKKRLKRLSLFCLMLLRWGKAHGSEILHITTPDMKTGARLSWTFGAAFS